MNFVPRRPATVAPSGRVTLPSGLAASQIADLQGALYALGHAPPTVITGRMPIGTQAQLLAFQTNYNAEQAARGYRYSPRTLDLDGGWGPNTQRALTNYIPWARTVLMQRGVLPGTVYSQNAPGVSMAPIGGQVTSTTPAKTAQIGAVPTINPLAGGPLGKQSSPGAAPTPSMQGGASPQVAAPAPGVAPSVAPASTFPIVPVAVVGVGVLALGTALYLRSQRKGRKGGG
jgi:hypothetical protein